MRWHYLSSGDPLLVATSVPNALRQDLQPARAIFSSRDHALGMRRPERADVAPHRLSAWNGAEPHDVSGH
jgi:hypothetical protein